MNVRTLVVALAFVACASAPAGRVLTKGRYSVAEAKVASTPTVVAEWAREGERVRFEVSATKYLDPSSPCPNAFLGLTHFAPGTVWRFDAPVRIGERVVEDAELRFEEGAATVSFPIDSMRLRALRAGAEVVVDAHVYGLDASVREALESFAPQLACP